MYRVLVGAVLVAVSPQPPQAVADPAAIAAPPSPDALGDLATRWWQWRIALPELAVPSKDPVGHFCDVGQAGDTWFLAGLLGFGASPAKPVRRTCRVPTGRRLFFPLVTAVRIPHDDVTCDKAAPEVAAQIDAAKGLFVKLDGVDLAIPRQGRWASGQDCFPLRLRADGPSANLTAAADGYWLALGPLPPGHHTLAYGGTLEVAGGEARPQDTTYELDIR